MSLVAKNGLSDSPAATQADPDPATNAQTGPATAAQAPSGEVPYLMKLPPELRTDILERVLQPAFAAEPYSLVPPPELPVTMYASLTRLPAVLQVNQTIRIERTALFIGMARSKIAELEAENRKIYPEHQALRKELEAKDDLGWSWNVDLRALGDKVMNNFTAMRDTDSCCRALERTYEPKHALPPCWRNSGW